MKNIISAGTMSGSRTVALTPKLGENLVNICTGAAGRFPVSQGRTSWVTQLSDSMEEGTARQLRGCSENRVLSERVTRSSQPLQTAFSYWDSRNLGRLR